MNELISSQVFAPLFVAFIGIFSIACILSLVFIASLHLNGAKPRAVAIASFSCLMKLLGISLMSIGAVPTFYSVLAPVDYSGQKYFSYLMLFALGGIIFLWFDSIAEKINSASKAIPMLIYLYTLKITGLIISFSSLIALVVNIIMPDSKADSAFWTMPLALFLYGALLSWCSGYMEKEEDRLGSFGNPIPVNQDVKKTAKKPANKKR